MSERKIPKWLPVAGQAIVVVGRSGKCYNRTVAEVQSLDESRIRIKLFPCGVLDCFDASMQKAGLGDIVFISNFNPRWNLVDGDEGMALELSPVRELLVVRHIKVWPRPEKKKKAAA